MASTVGNVGSLPTISILTIKSSSYSVSGTLLSPLHKKVLLNLTTTFGFLGFFPSKLPLKYHYYTHFADEDTGTETLSNLPQIIQLVNGRALKFVLLELCCTT